MAKEHEQGPDLYQAMTGRRLTAGEYVGQTILGRKVWKKPQPAGTVTGTSPCRMEGCRGVRLHVKWADGRRTYPCAKGVNVRPDGTLEIT